MDDQSNLVEPPEQVDAFEIADADDQGELFGPRHARASEAVVTRLPDLIPKGFSAPLVKADAVQPPGLISSCACLNSNGRNFFGGPCAPNLAKNDRLQFFENCLSAQENERLKLGRELHDSTGQLLLALRLEIAHLRNVGSTAAQNSLLDEIEETAREIDREIRAFAFTHYPAEIGSEGLGPALRSLVRGFAKRTGLTINFSSIPDPITNTGKVALALLRIAQEALLNVHRHARAVQVEMSLQLRRNMLELTIMDDGVGIPSENMLQESHGVGLQGMRHRIERLGGQFAIKRMKRGTKIVAVVPA